MYKGHENDIPVYLCMDVNFICGYGPYRFCTHFFWLGVKSCLRAAGYATIYLTLSCRHDVIMAPFTFNTGNLNVQG